VAGFLGINFVGNIHYEKNGSIPHKVFKIKQSSILKTVPFTLALFHNSSPREKKVRFTITYPH